MFLQSFQRPASRLAVLQKFRSPAGVSRRQPHFSSSPHSICMSMHEYLTEENKGVFILKSTDTIPLLSHYHLPRSYVTILSFLPSWLRLLQGARTPKAASQFHDADTGIMLDPNRGLGDRRASTSENDAHHRDSFKCQCNGHFHLP